MAYIDPGSGSMLLQVLLSMVIGGWFVFRRTLADGVRRLTGRAPKRVQAAADSTAPDAPPGPPSTSA